MEIREVTTDYVSHFIIKKLLSDKEFLSVARLYIPANKFPHQEQRLLVKRLYEYYDKYQSIPEDPDYLVQNIPDKRKQLLKDYLTDKIEKLPETYSSYVLDEIDKVVKLFELESLSKQLSVCVEQRDLDTAFKLFEKGQKLLFGKFYDDRYREVLSSKEIELALIEDPSEIIFKYNIEPFDEALGGIKRGDFISILAKTNVGKSWFCIYLGVCALLYGCKVIHYTTEMTRNQTLKRYAMSIAVSPIEIDEEDYYGEDIFKVLEEQLSIYKDLGGSLYVIEKPDLKLGDIYNDVLWFETIKGILPDVIIIDSADDISCGNRNIYETSKFVYESLRRLGLSKNIAIITPSQVKPESLNKDDFLNEYDYAYGRVKGFIADIGISINQITDQEAILYLFRSRRGVKDIAVKIRQNLNRGQFVESVSEVNG